MDCEAKETASSKQNREVGDEEVVGFSKSLQELRDLRSQLHYAADYCENTFLNSHEKKDVVENTQEYICRAVVTIVDHLGRVSSDLNDCFFTDRHISDAELRILCLKQRLLSCEQYTHKLALSQLKWDPHMPKYHQRYPSKISTIDLSLPRAKTIFAHKESVAVASTLGGREAPNPTFHFQATGVTQKRGRNSLSRKSRHGTTDHILSLIRRTKRAT